MKKVIHNRIDSNTLFGVDVGDRYKSVKPKTKEEVRKIFDKVRGIYLMFVSREDVKKSIEIELNRLMNMLIPKPKKEGQKMKKTELQKFQKELIEALAPTYGAFGFFCMGKLEEGNKYAEESGKLFKALLKRIDKQIKEQK